MKTALYIENGVTQIVLTPENEFERNITTRISGKATLVLGGFYKCRGGWDRQDEAPQSLMVRLEKEPPNMTDPVNVA